MSATELTEIAFPRSLCEWLSFMPA